MSKYIKDVTEDEKKSRSYGDEPVLEAGEKEKVQDYEKVGNQKDEYYKK